MLHSIKIENSLWVDIIGSLFFLILAYGVAHYFDFFEILYQLTRSHEEYELDEFLLFALLLPVPLSWLFYRQIKRASLEIKRRHNLEIATIKANKMQSLGVLAGGVAHEFNNKLLPIIIMSELVQKHMEPSNPDFQRMALILKSAQNAQKTVAKISDFSRSDGLKIEYCDLNTSWQSLRKMLETICPKNIVLDIAEEGFKGQIHMSEGDFQGMIMNLFINAIDAIGNKSGKVTLKGKIEDINSESIHLHLASGLYAAITVEDNGPGMAAENKNKIFDPFFTTKPPGQGVGLGLSIVFRCIQDAGGLILIEKNSSKGCQFKLYIPLEGNG